MKTYLRTMRTTKTYKVYFLNVPHHTTELLTYVEWKDKYLSRSKFHQIFNELYFWAASSCVYENLRAVIKCNDKEIMVIDCKTVNDGSNITTNFSKDGQLLRAVTVAA